MITCTSFLALVKVVAPYLDKAWRATTVSWKRNGTTHSRIVLFGSDLLLPSLKLTLHGSAIGGRPKQVGGCSGLHENAPQRLPYLNMCLFPCWWYCLGGILLGVALLEERIPLGWILKELKVLHYEHVAPRSMFDIKSEFSVSGSCYHIRPLLTDFLAMTGSYPSGTISQINPSFSQSPW